MDNTQKLAILQRIHDNKQYERVTINGKRVLIDGTSASITLQVYNALSPANKEKLLSFDLDKMIYLAVKTANKANEKARGQ